MVAFHWQCFNVFIHFFLVLQSIFLFFHFNNHVLNFIIDFIWFWFYTSIIISLFRHISPCSCNKTGFFFPETDCFIVFPVTLAFFSSTNGVLLNKSSVSRDINCEWPTQCAGLTLYLKHFLEDTQNGFFRSSQLLGFTHSSLFQCSWKFQAFQYWLASVSLLFIPFYSFFGFFA